MHKSKIIGIFSKKLSGRYSNGQNTFQIWILLKIYGQFWSNNYKNRQLFRKNYMNFGMKLTQTSWETRMNTIQNVY